LRSRAGVAGGRVRRGAQAATGSGRRRPRSRPAPRTGSFANVCDLTVAAALEGRRDHVLHAAILDPHTASTLTLDRIGALVDEMLDAHRPLLGAALAA
jgi:hypothetical protein